MENKRLSLPTWVSILLVLGVYIWFISIGPWRARGYTSDYYSRLASSFQQGTLALEEKPDPALLALPNPYDHKARKNIQVVGDASLYEGKYYLYFGPFPSLPLALVTAILPIKPGDQIFVYLFIAGLFIIQCLLFIEIVRRFFVNLPDWFISLGILVLGLTGPFTRMLAHPYIHEAAIAGGQFFFTTGFYFAFLALKEKPVHMGKLSLAGILWACTAATRTTQLLPIGFMVALTWLFIFNEYRKSGDERKIGSSTLALIGPLIVCGVMLAWYNWARFDSIFEFGLYYQLAAFNLQANYSILFSRVYVIQNIFNYFLNPFEVTGNFPYVHPVSGSEKPVFTSIELPNLYAVEGRFAGALYSTPFLLFAVLPPIMFIKTFVERLRNSAQKKEIFDLFDWTVIGLLGSAIAGSIPALLLFYVGFRYETEFIASLTLLALIGFCQAYVVLKNMAAHRVLTIAGTFLAVYSVLVNLALSYGGVRG
ncbi:MAG TPA: hypothetical protein VJ785_16345 [Anaerolineales bacterium]|nr:hypothetical protein [Anaerolineales bacterium]